MAELVRRLPREMEGLFDRFINDPFLAQWAGGRSEDLASWTPAVDVVEEAEAYVFFADLPGVTKDRVELTFEDNILTISGERGHEEDPQKGQFRRVERRHGKFTRSFSLPAQVDANKVDATFRDGVLVIRVPKAEAARARRIKIG